jgi:pilus assembly protein Flp/PilA
MVNVGNSGDRFLLAPAKASFVNLGRFWRLFAAQLTKQAFSEGIPKEHSAIARSERLQDASLGASAMRTLFCKFVRDDSGATAIEYGLIASLIALVIITSVTAVGSKLTNTFTEVSSNLH